MADESTPRSLDEPDDSAPSLTDPMTGLLNRRGFQLALDHHDDEPVGVVLGDVDHFMAINDVYGHDEGNRVLHQIAQRIEAAAPSDSIVGRFGGNQFLVFLPGVRDLQVVQSAALAMLHTCDSPFAVGDGVIDVNFSVGIAIAEPGDLRGGIHAADVAAMTAKVRGRARAVCLDPAWEAR